MSSDKIDPWVLMCVVLWAVVSTEQLADKKALKIIKVQERGISVLTTTDRSVVSSPSPTGQ